MRKQPDPPVEYADDGGIVYRMNTGLGEWCVERAKSLDVPCREVTFYLSKYPAKISVLEALKGKSGYLLLNHLSINSLDKEDFLLFAGFTDEMETVPHDVLAQLFKLDGAVGSLHYITRDADLWLQNNMKLLVNSTMQKSMENNNALFKERQEQLTRWVDDQIAVAERELKQIKLELRSANHAVELAADQTELSEAMERVDALERKKRRARRNIDNVEEEYEGKRKTILTALKRKLVQNVTNTPLFTIYWKIQ